VGALSRAGRRAGAKSGVGVVDAPALAVGGDGDRKVAPGDSGLALRHRSELAHSRFVRFEGPLDRNFAACLEGAASFVEGRDDVGGEVANGHWKETGDELLGADGP
jgi:hypothetical protein